MGGNISLLSGGQPNAFALQSCLIQAVGNENVAFPDTPNFAAKYVKLYNIDVPAFPLAVVTPKTNEQVAAAVTCARNNKAKVQARGGGHGYANYVYGGGNKNTVTIELTNFKQYSINRNTWEVTIGAGTILGELTKNLEKDGRAMAYGTCPQVGIGGHATMGGLGPPSRMWGTSLDHMNEMTVVLANSSIITASRTSYPEVYWSMKGAGASFGIVTQFKARTQASPKSNVQFSYTISKRPFSSLANRFRQWQRLAANPNFSRKFASQLVLSEVGMILQGTYFGPQNEFTALNISSLFPDASNADVTVFNKLGGVIGKWAEDQALTLVGGTPASFYSKNLAFTKDNLLTDATIDKWFSYLDTADKGTPLWFGIFDLAGGAINDVPTDATAYGQRDALFYFQSYAVGIPSISAKSKAFVTGMNEVIQKSQPNNHYRAYAGYIDPQLPNAQLEYFGSNYPRLQQLKAIIDPLDVFSNPQSVKLPGQN